MRRMVLLLLLSFSLTAKLFAADGPFGCIVAPVVDERLAAELETKSELLKGLRRDPASYKRYDQLWVYLHTRYPDVTEEVLEKKLLSMICVFARDPGSGLSDSDRKILEQIPEQVTEHGAVPVRSLCENPSPLFGSPSYAKNSPVGLMRRSHSRSVDGIWSGRAPAEAEPINERAASCEGAAFVHRPLCSTLRTWRLEVASIAADVRSGAVASF